MLPEVSHEVAALHFSACLYPYSDRFALCVGRALFGQQRTVRFEDQFDCFFEIPPNLRESSALRVHAGDFLDSPDVPATLLFDDCCEFALHASPFAQSITGN